MFACGAGGDDGVEQVCGGLAPRGHVDGRRGLAVGVEFNGVRGDEEIAGEIGRGGNGTVEDGVRVEEEDALKGFRAVEGLGAGVERLEEGVDEVEEVVGEEGGVFGRWGQFEV